jgi:TusA-related sulfurtransferase
MGNIHEFDLRGQICPSTLLIALREINRNSADIRSGRHDLLFKTNNRDSVQTIPESAQNMGFTVEVTESAGEYHILIKGRREES